MTISHPSFDAATAALRPGVNLVEAGAGTGKTFAIAMLMLRLVTELGLPLPRILVVTFTRAATEELRDRIRTRLAGARELLAKGLKTPPGQPGLAVDGRAGATDDRDTDPALAAWRAGLATRGIGEELARQRLELALLDMDLAPIFTIHGFCQRMLQEQALESGQLFDFELTTDVADLRREVVLDHWRRVVYPLSPLHCSLITQTFETPDQLAASVEPASRKVARIEPPTLALTQALTAFDQSLGNLADWWRRHAQHLRPRLDQAVADGLFRAELRANLPRWWDQTDALLNGDASRLPAAWDFLAPDKILNQLNGNRFRTGGGISGTDKKQAFLDSLSLPGAELARLEAARAAVILALRADLIRELAEGLPQALRRKGLLGYDDLTTQLARSLTGSPGAELRRVLGRRYTAALIDEFQDTDDAQFTIFSTLFADPSHLLYLIGDPKQAIYTFRGADITSYFKARQQADHHLNLDRNHRSHPALVAAVNRLFGGREDAFACADLPYHPVQPARIAEDGQLLRNDQPLAALLYYQLDDDPRSGDGRWSATRATARIVSSVVAETTRLLQDANPVTLQTADQPPRPLGAGDIAILVRTHKQGEAFQNALARAGIPAVMASRQSVFATTECDQLLLLLQALAAPGDPGLIGAALTLPWFGLDGAHWFKLWRESPTQPDRWLNRFSDYHRLWRDQGLLVMMNRLLEEEAVLLHLARLPLAERRIANIHHLLELIQAAAAQEAMGPERTLQWLHTIRRAAKTSTRGPEETELRLESDQAAVTIVTMHGAKGLEYPVVFCPFLWQRGHHIQNSRDCVICHDPDRTLVMDLGSPIIEGRRERALQEELAEELRLAYVALTRARCRCTVYWAEVRGSTRGGDSRDSALAWLLSLETDGDFGQRAAALQTADGMVVCARLAAETEAPTPLNKKKEEPEELTPLLFPGPTPHSDWTLHSYSSLTAGRPADRPEPDQAPTQTHDAGAADLLPDLPKGAALGNVVHALLETIPFAALAKDQSGYRAEFRRQCAWFGVEADPGDLAALLHKVVRTPLTADVPFTLADLPPEATIREMPFYLRLQPGSTSQINAILAGCPAFTPVTHRVLQGYLTGFIDLVCRHRGKYYIMDYKSNHLGDRLDHYRPESLTRAMAEHNYGLQYWLYALMLHRYLRMSRQDYDYATHFGGIIYLFVRGMEPSRPGSGVYFDLPDFAVLEELESCLAGGHSCAIPGARGTGPSLAGGATRGTDHA